MKLTAKQQAWIDYYKQGHTAAEAARLAGYQAKSDHSFGNIGYENLKKLRAFVIDRDAVLESPRIADMAEINAFWTGIIRDETKDLKDRLKASELRARAAGGFIERPGGDADGKRVVQGWLKPSTPAPSTTGFTTGSTTIPTASRSTTAGRAPANPTARVRRCF